MLTIVGRKCVHVYAEILMVLTTLSLPSSLHSQTIEPSQNSTNLLASIPIGRTPQQIGYPEYIKYIRSGISIVSAIPANMPLSFPIGQNYPIRFSNPSVANSANTLLAIGFIDRQGNFQPFSSSIISETMNWHLDTLRGGFERSQHIAIFSATSRSNKVPVINLVVTNPNTGNRQVIRSVNAVSLARDMINAALNNRFFQNSPPQNNPTSIPALPL